MAQGTMSQGYPMVYDINGEEHEASDYIDHELQTEHENLQHVHGPDHSHQTSEPSTNARDMIQDFSNRKIGDFRNRIRLGRELGRK